jgi:hypothetical protein
MNEVQRLEVKFREALTSGDAVTLHEIHARAVALVTKRKLPPVIAANKKAYERLIRSYVCHVASNDTGIPYVLWWRAYFGEETIPKKPRHPVGRSRSHLREMRKHSGFTSRLCNKYKIMT